MIKYLLLALLSTSVTATEFDVKSYLDKTHVTIGVGYKLEEKLDSYTGEPVPKSPTARFEVYYQYSDSIKFGVSHHSQYAQGAPFNNDSEYVKTELFIDYTFSLGELM